MEIPHLVREHLGGEAIESTVSLGDEDVVCVTPTRALVYRGDGLLSDESVETFALDVERFDVSEGRRKTKFVFEYVDGKESFTVPGSRADTLLTLLLQGILRVDDVIGEEESVAGVYQFSELALVVAESRLVKHIGSVVWDEDFEAYDYDDVSGLEFEEGSVATQIVVTVDGRPQRIKAPNDQAPKVEQTLVQTLCTYHDVSSLEELKRTLAASEPSDDGDSDAGDESSRSASGDIGLEGGISPLVGGDGDDESEAGGASDNAGETAETAQRASADRSNRQATSSARSESGGTADATAERSTETRQPSSQSARTGGAGESSDASAIDSEDIEAMQEQLAALTEVVKRQNELLEKHDTHIENHDERLEQLIDELRRGR